MEVIYKVSFSYILVAAVFCQTVIQHISYLCVRINASTDQNLNVQYTVHLKRLISAQVSYQLMFLVLSPLTNSHEVVSHTVYILKKVFIWSKVFVSEVLQSYSIYPL